MKRFLSTLLIACMLFSMVQTTVVTVLAGHNPLEDYVDTTLNPEGPQDMQDDTWEPENNPPIEDPTLRPSDPSNDVNNSSQNNTTNNGYNEIIDTTLNPKDDSNDYSKNEEDEHNFKNGKCKECGYVAKNCKHKETKQVITYWCNSVNERGNDASYVEYDVICTYCKLKIDTVVYHGPVTAIKASSKCDHDNVEEKSMGTYYEPCTEEKHYKLTKYEVVCLDCEEKFNSYTEEREENHEIADGKCTKCIHELPKVEVEEESKVEPSKNTTNTPTEKPNNVVSSKPTTSAGNKDPNKSSQTTNKPQEVVEEFYISTKYTSYSVNFEKADWKNLPKEANGTLQVPLREFAEIMGWKVTWDSKKNVAYVTDGKTTKTIIPNSDVYLMKSNGEREIGVALSNKSQIIDGVLYADLEAMLEGTEYAYYKNDTIYRITERSEVINWVSKDKLSGRNQLETSENLYESEDYLLEVAKGSTIYAIEEGEDSYYYTVIVPMAEQAVYGEYYNGETTMEGVFARIIVGELPGVGTASDFRDIASDFQNWEWTWSHAGTTFIDVIGLVPVLGSLKYADELALAAKNADDIADVAKRINKVTDVSKNADNVADATKSASKIAEAAKASIKSIDDLKKLTKNEKIYSDSFWEHVFYGNETGGYHYKGLTNAKGQITSIIKDSDKNGVYRAKITISGTKSKESTFFPDNWTPKEVIETVEEAYANTNHKANGIADYAMPSGIKIRLVFNENCQIKSAFPLY